MVSGAGSETRLCRKRVSCRGDPPGVSPHASGWTGHSTLTNQAMASKWMRMPRARDTLTTVAKLGFPVADSAL